MDAQRIEVIEVMTVEAELNERSTTVCLAAFSLDIVKKCCYRFAAKHVSGLEVTKDGAHAAVKFLFPREIGKAQQEEILSHFHRDLIDQELRERISAKTEVVRNLILANAFANTSLISDEK